MTSDSVISIGQEALRVTALISAPILLSVLAIGVVIGMFQAATSINEMTLSFIPKLIILALVLAVAGSWMLDQIVEFTKHIFEMIPELIG
ncbi:Flagellar biosynthesis protein FliQ [hydrothermal vent metagenome]|uniref:Flagellar biosynthesis protein FliQ n=1 Tax=hydrothermal vent metagenome TaxID=652676 RepID=A0A3B0XUR5_9ZZZZ